MYKVFTLDALDKDYARKLEELLIRERKNNLVLDKLVPVVVPAYHISEPTPPSAQMTVVLKKKGDG